MSETWDKMVEVSVGVQAIVAPWKAYTGLVELWFSSYCAKESIFALDNSRTISGLGQGVLMHPDSLPLWRRKAEQFTDHSMSNGELAAFLYWWIHQRKGKARVGS